MQIVFTKNIRVYTASILCLCAALYMLRLSGRLISIELYGKLNVTRENTMNVSDPLATSTDLAPSPFQYPNNTERVKLQFLAEDDLVHQHVTVQNFKLSDLDGNMFQNETIPIYVDVKNIQRYLKDSWYSSRPTNNGSYNQLFTPTLSNLERQQMVMLVEAFSKACTWANVTYFLSAGSLLGAYRHHGMIPWDDDIDVFVKSSHWKKMHYSLSRIPGFSIYTSARHLWKFYITESSPTVHIGFKWPFIDIFFYAENATHLWGISDFMDGTFPPYNKSYIYPLQLRPFENLLLPMRCNTPSHLTRHWSLDDCSSPRYSHKLRKGKIGTAITCKELHRYLPFVFRVPDGNGNLKEVLKVGDRIIHTLTAPPFCSQSI